MKLALLLILIVAPPALASGLSKRKDLPKVSIAEFERRGCSVRSCTP